ncbi:MAG: thioredoxin family protein [Planctomycetota bacterium]
MSDEDVRTITVGRARVGLLGLGAIFEELEGADETPSEELSARLVELAGGRNYIPQPARAAYARALLDEYRRHLGEDVPQEAAGLSIKVLGPGCVRCERLAADVVSALDALGLAADVEHVTDPARIGEYGVMGTPALVVNGRIIAAGSAPSAEEIRKMLTKGAEDG